MNQKSFGGLQIQLWIFLLYILVEKKDDKQIIQVKKKVVSDIIEKNKNKERKGIENRYLLFITAKQISTNLQCEKYTSITSQTRWVRTQALLSWVFSQGLLRL